MIKSIRALIHPLVKYAALAAQPYKVIEENTAYIEPSLPVIFAANHSEYPDGPVMSAIVPEHALLFAGKQRLNLSGKLFFFLNGTIWVDRMDKSSMSSAKTQLVNTLISGKNVIWFPEATWNITQSLPMLPMKWGIITAAREANAQIVPVALHYDRKNMVVRVRWGSPIFGSDLYDNSSGIELLRDTLASMRWFFWETGPVLCRSEIDILELQALSEAPMQEYQLLSAEYEQSVIFHPFLSAKEVFPNIYAKRENAFLFRKDLSG